jgi:NAD(P)-dependent dehydrogenase (short-subunit alcohol dehydrogenase family)
VERVEPAGQQSKQGAVNDAVRVIFPSLRGKSVFVTGGGSGIGEAIVTGFAQQGARVAFVDLAVDGSLALCERLVQIGLHKPLFRQCDIRDIPALRATMTELAGLLGDVDVLVNNAGNDQRHTVAEVTPQFYDDRVAINQRPMFFTCQFALEGMKRRGGGAIINLGSTSWHIANGGYPVYTQTKAAVSGLTRGLARDLGPFNIRVNTVTPGWVMTERQLQLWVDAAAERVIDEKQCLKRRVMPRDVADMVLFLASDAARYVTGTSLVIDGGLSA